MPKDTKTTKSGTKSPRTKKGTKKTGGKKRTKVETSAVVEEAPVVVEEPVVVEAPVVKEVPAVVVTDTPEVTEEASGGTSDTRPEDALTAQLSGLLDSVALLMTQLKTVQTEVRSVQKNYTKLVKEHDKTTNKRRRQYRKPSGFAKPSPLSDEMTEFLGLEKGVEIARNEVTKLINKYIVENDLRDESDKRKILPDKKLSTLLNLSGDENLSYFNLQKYIKHHFVKAEAVPVA